MIILIDSEDMSVEGEFKSVNEAKQHLRDSMMDAYEGWDSIKSGDDEKWAFPYYICEVKEIVKPVPNVKITVKLRTIKEA